MSQVSPESRKVRTQGSPIGAGARSELPRRWRERTSHTGLAGSSTVPRLGDALLLCSTQQQALVAAGIH
jgi:hypothetical protein